MIGEIRDRETAELGFRAAQTGHLVLSTLHTNDALGAVPRLLDLGVEASIGTASLLGVLAQQLVREVCGTCKEEYAPSAALLRGGFDIPPMPFRRYRGRGCAACQQTGDKGRMVIAELWTPSEDDVMLINRGASLDELARSAEKSSIGMAEDALTRLREGRTTVEELIRALPHSILRKLRLTAI